MRTANREKPYSYTNSAVSRQVYVHALLVQHLYSVFFQYMVWYGPTSETAWMQRRQKKWLKNTDFAELKKITSRIYSTVRTVFPNLFMANAPFSNKQISIAPQPCLAHISTQFFHIVYLECLKMIKARMSAKMHFTINFNLVN